TDWLDTEESQNLLQYQTRSFEEFVVEYSAAIGFKRHLAKLFRTKAMKQLLGYSPYNSEEST
ncbi:MAG: NAD(P)-dependent oxidoreductase, partial [Candidatus Hodarchaeota archaeon]